MIFDAVVVLCLTSTAYAATAADVITTNSNLLSQVDTIDIAVVAVTAQTPPTTAQKVPTSLQSLASAISAAQESLTPVTPTSDGPTETNVALSWGYFANSVEELLDDYVRQSALLINTFGLKSAIYNQLLTFNTTFNSYTAFMGTVVTDGAYKTEIANNGKAEYGNLGGDTDGMLQAFRYYA
ncbi:hypothetical protein ACLMJK_001208 [Lecanora helva]